MDTDRLSGRQTDRQMDKQIARSISKCASTKVFAFEIATERQTNINIKQYTVGKERVRARVIFYSLFYCHRILWDQNTSPMQIEWFVFPLSLRNIVCSYYKENTPLLGFLSALMASVSCCTNDIITLKGRQEKTSTVVSNNNREPDS